MKKLTIIFLLFIYMIPAIGISVTGHYCGGRLVEVTLNLPEDGTCVCGNKKKSDCCKTKTISIKLKEVHKTNPQLSVNTSSNLIKQIVYSVPSIFSFQIETPNAYNFASAHPPNNTGQSIYLVNRVIRI
ncbi:MAG: hypothetical protein KA841_00020 [Chitinophagales bacterium]|nr:hypothetical protein [Chitinophagales bacterium]